MAKTSKAVGGKPWQARPAQSGSHGSGQNVYAPLSITSKVGESVNQQGNEQRLHGKEPGRVGDQRVNARFSSGVDPKGSITPGSVYLHRG